jgi:Zinc-binding dehydrogenase
VNVSLLPWAIAAAVRPKVLLIADNLCLSQQLLVLQRRNGRASRMPTADSPVAKASMSSSNDGPGPKTFQGSLDSLRRSGTFCWYGPVLGGPGPLDLMSLPKSIKIGYATFFDHIHTPALLRGHAAQLFDWIGTGELKVRIGGVYPLHEAARAQADMESRATTGKLLLIP